MPNLYAVIGLGIFGKQVCEVLTSRGGKVIAIDNDPEKINKIREISSQAILMDATDEEALGAAALDQVDAAVVAIGDNIEASILTTTLLKRLAIPHIVARAVNKIHYQVLIQVGANEVINIEEDEGTRVATKLIAPSIMDRISLSEEASLIELYAPPAFCGKKLPKLDLRQKYGVNIVAIRRTLTTLDKDGNPQREATLIMPSREDELKEGDILFVIGSEAKVDAFRKSGE